MQNKNNLFQLLPHLFIIPTERTKNSNVGQIYFNIFKQKVQLPYLSKNLNGDFLTNLEQTN